MLVLRRFDRQHSQSCNGRKPSKASRIHTHLTWQAVFTTAVHARWQLPYMAGGIHNRRTC